MREIKFRFWDVEQPYMMSWEEATSEWDTDGYAPNMLDGDHWIPMQFTGLPDKNCVDIYEDDIVFYYTTFHKSESAIDLFGVEPKMDFDAGCEYHRRYAGIIKFFPSTGFILSNVKVYECVSKGEYAHQVSDADWEYISKQSTKIMSCTKERCKVIGNKYENPEMWRLK